MFSSVRFSNPVSWVGMVAMCGLAPAAAAGIVADNVVEYAAGTISSSGLQQSGNAALGLPASVDDGQTSPFTPPFHASAITIVGGGGHITLHFSAPLAPGDGPDIGVYTNTGLLATTSNGVTISASAAGGGPAVFSRDAARVSVSADGSTWVALAGGNVVDLTMPSNAFMDGVLNASGGIHVSGGQTPADPFKPFGGNLTQFAGLTYLQMQTLLNGSFGGAWIDASGTGLGEINFVRFDVPAGSRLVLDAVTGAQGVPEPAAWCLLAVGCATMLVRRRACAGR